VYSTKHHCSTVYGTNHHYLGIVKIVDGDWIKYRNRSTWLWWPRWRRFEYQHSINLL